jgi:ABC-type multidrug transport system fused ATPase/permease subunit
MLRRKKRRPGPGAWAEWASLPRTRPYLRPYRGLLGLSFFLTIVASLVAIAEPWPLAVMLDSVIGNRPPPSWMQPVVGEDPGRYFLLVLVVTAGFLQVVLSHGLTVVHDYINATAEQNMVLDLRSDLFAHVEKLSLTFHDERQTGQLMSQINMQASSLGAVIMAFPPIFQSSLTVFGMLVIALLIDWQVTLLALVAVPLLYYAIGLYGTKIVPRVRFVMGLEWKSLSIVYEAMSMLRVIVSFGRERYEHRRFREQGQTAVDERVKLTVRQTLFSLGVATATGLGTALVLGFGALHVINGQITTGELVVLLSYIASIYMPLEMISTTLGDMHQQFVFLNASLNLLDQEPEVVEHPQARDIGQAQGRVSFENVSFSYKKRKNTIRDITFEVEPGQRTAIVGPTGAGKTTLVNLLVRFYDPKSGTIKIDGTDVRRIKLASLRQQISLVLQEPLLFSGTIAENIRYGRLDASMDDVVAAAKAANSHEFISNLPAGYDTELGERGAQLSGGERQRIAVARAFVRDAPILILDEPTSSIDSKTENVILDALDELMVGRTSFMIAHRLSTVRNVDKLLVLNAGQLVEQGTHDELLAAGGLYTQLYDAQSSARKATVDAEDEDLTAKVIESITISAGRHAAELEEDVTAEEPPAPVAEPPAPAHVAGPPEPEQAGPPAAEPAAEEPPAEQPPEAPAPGRPEHREPVGAGAWGSGHSGGENGHRGDDQDDDANGRAELLGARNGQGRLIRIDGPREDIHCDFCTRTLLKGETAEPFLAPTGSRQGRLIDGESDPFLSSYSQHDKHEQALVCELCWSAAEEKGWIMLATIGRQ